MKAVVVRELYYSCDGSKILNGVSMSVKQGAIYGLLGPSGCGKTTLLKCLLGCMKADEGSIEIFGQKVSSKENQNHLIGYMPQDLSLYKLFNITETLRYFSILANMSKEVFDVKKKELRTLLELPETEIVVKKLSSGQQRRLSLAVTLLNSPQLLILDEPTVGINPEVREKIWSYLVMLAGKGTTVVITTHYIEEAVSAQVIAFMREGKILIEEEPKRIKQQFSKDTDSLEAAFVNVCKLGVKQHAISMELNSQSSETSNDLNENRIQLSGNISNEVKEKNGREAYMWKMKNAFKKRILFLFFYSFLPVLSVHVATGPCRPLGNIPVAVVNEDIFNLSHLIVNSIPSLLSVTNYTSLELAVESLKSHENEAIYLVPENFSLTLSNPTLSPIKPVVMFVNGINPRALSVIELSLLFAFNKTAHEWNQTMPRQFKDQFNVQQIEGLREERVRQTLNMGYCIIMWTVILVAVSTELSFEMASGFLERSLIAGLKPFDVFIPLFNSYFYVSLIQTFLLVLYINFYVFKQYSLTKFAAVYFLTMQQCCCVVLVAIVMSLLIKKPAVVGLVALATFFAMVIASGDIRSLEAMNKIISIPARFLPSYFNEAAVHVIMLRDASLLSQSVLAKFAAVCVWIVILLVLMRCLRKRIYA